MAPPVQVKEGPCAVVLPGHQGGRHSRRELAELLWPQATSDTPRRTCAAPLPCLPGPYTSSCAEALDLRARNHSTNGVRASILRKTLCRSFWASKGPLKTLLSNRRKRSVHAQNRGQQLEGGHTRGVCFEVKAHLCGLCSGHRYGYHGCRSRYGVVLTTDLPPEVLYRMTGVRLRKLLQGNAGLTSARDL